MKEFVLITFGTVGDVNPFFGLGVALQERGHKVSIISYDIYKKFADNAGLKFIPCDSTIYKQQLTNKDANNPIKFLNILVRLASSVMRETYQALTTQFDPKNIVVVVNFPLVFGAHIARDKFKFPIVTIGLSPSLFFSAIKPPILPMFPTFLENLPFILRRAILAIIKKYVDHYTLPEINQFRGELGLSKIDTIYDWLLSSERVICLFPSWFGKIQADWPQQTLQTGFINVKGDKSEHLSVSLKNFLDEGKPPIVFTCGSHLNADANFFKVSIEVANQLNIRAVILTRFAENIPKPLPKNFICVEYATFDLLLPRVLAIVHHGGIGTLAEALKNIVPQLIVPRSADQFDNAIRLEELGCGLFLLPKHYQTHLVKKTIEQLIHSETIQENCKNYAKLINFEQAAEETCDLLEQV